MLGKTVKTVFFHRYLDFGQHLLTKYCRYGLRTLGACKTIAGLPPFQFWCQYLQNFCRETILKFFPSGTRCWNNYVRFMFQLEITILSLQVQHFIFNATFHGHNATWSILSQDPDFLSKMFTIWNTSGSQNWLKHF